MDPRIGAPLAAGFGALLIGALILLVAGLALAVGAVALLGVGVVRLVAVQGHASVRRRAEIETGDHCW